MRTVPCSLLRLHFTILLPGNEIISYIFASWMSTNNSGQIILRNLGEFYIVPWGPNNKINFMINTPNNRQGIILRKHGKMISSTNSWGINCVIHKSPMVIHICFWEGGGVVCVCVFLSAGEELLSGMGKGVFWKRGLLRRIHFLELEILDKLWKTKENPTIV